MRNLGKSLIVATALLSALAPQAKAQQAVGNLRVENALRELSSVGLQALTNIGGFPRIANTFTFGTQANAAGQSMVVNSNHVPQVIAGVPGTAIANYQGRDSVSLYIDNTGPPFLFTQTASSFDATHAFFTTPISGANIAKLKIGQFVVTQAGGVGANAFTGMITAIDPAGASISVNNWTVPGNSTSGQFPLASDTVNFNPITSIFAMNPAVFINAGTPLISARIAEADLWNNVAVTNGANALLDSPLVQGFDVTTTGTAGASIAYQARGNIRDAFLASTGFEAGYLYDPTLQTPPFTPGTLGGFVARQNSNPSFNAINATSGLSVFSVTGGTGAVTTSSTITATSSISTSGNLNANGGDVEIGLGLSAGGAAVADYHFGGDASDFNIRTSNSSDGRFTISSKRGTLVSVRDTGGATTTANALVVQTAVTGFPVVLSPTGDATAGIQLQGATTGPTTLGSTGTTGSPVVTAGAQHDGALTFVTTVTSGATQTLAVNKDGIELENATVVAAQTILLPPITGVSGQEFWMSSLGGVTALTVQTSAAGAITGSPTSLTAVTVHKFVSDGTTWWPIQ